MRVGWTDTSAPPGHKLVNMSVRALFPHADAAIEFQSGNRDCVQRPSIQIRRTGLGYGYDEAHQENTAGV